MASTKQLLESFLSSNLITNDLLKVAEESLGEFGRFQDEDGRVPITALSQISSAGSFSEVSKYFRCRKSRRLRPLSPANSHISAIQKR